MKTLFCMVGCLVIAAINSTAQTVKNEDKLMRIGNKEGVPDTIMYISNGTDTSFIPSIKLSDVTVVSFKSKEDQMMYYKYKSRIQKVLPYVKIAKQLYVEIKSEKEKSKKRDYRHYRRDLEKEFRSKFEKELKDLTVSQGQMLFKLINRETSNNAYNIIKDIKGGFNAWFYQSIGKRWGYDLKENYDPNEEKMIELIIKEMGASYNVNS